MTRREVAHGNGRPLREWLKANPVVAYMDEPLRAAAYRMAETGKTRLPVLKRRGDRTLVGMIALRDLLRARTRHLEEERARERVLQVRFTGFGRARGSAGLSVTPLPPEKSGSSPGATD
ncbi:MAG TPA: CBS domain-containing protein [Candidatus Acidoferrales bacterium]|nr:CBS domain-containing protein [Candidatus Acidoferrales bacterium]